MKARTKLVILIAFVGQLAAEAGIQFGFWLDKNAYNATDIIVATEGSEIDGKLTVIETWEGKLRPNEIIVVPELAAYTNVDLRTEWGAEVAWVRAFGRTNPPVVATGSRMILFLKAKPTNADQSTGSSEWEAAADVGNRMQISTAWVENDKVFSFHQINNPGPLVLCPNLSSEQQVRLRASQIAFEKETLESIAGVSDTKLRAKLATPFIHSNGIYSAATAFSTLSSCGKTAVPILREILRDSARAGVHESALSALAHTGDRSALEDLRRALQADLIFWKEIGPRLPMNWWDKVDLKDPSVRACRERYGETLTTIRLLWEVRISDLDSLVKEIRDLWLSLPQLDESGKAWSSDGKRVGHSQIVEWADRVISSSK